MSRTYRTESGVNARRGRGRGHRIAEATAPRVHGIGGGLHFHPGSNPGGDLPALRVVERLKRRTYDRRWTPTVQHNDGDYLGCRPVRRHDCEGEATSHPGAHPGSGRRPAPPPREGGRKQAAMVEVPLLSIPSGAATDQGQRHRCRDRFDHDRHRQQSLSGRISRPPSVVRRPPSPGVRSRGQPGCTSVVRATIIRGLPRTTVFRWTPKTTSGSAGTSGRLPCAEVTRDGHFLIRAGSGRRNSMTHFSRVRTSPSTRTVPKPSWGTGTATAISWWSPTPGGPALLGRLWQPAGRRGLGAFD